MIILAWQLAGNHWRWSASPYGTTHLLLTTMVMSLQSSFLNFSVGLGAVRLLMLFDCKLNGRLSSNVDGHVDNYLLILCSMPLTIIVRLVFNIENPAMNNMTYMFINTLSSSLSHLLPHRCIHTFCFHIVLYNWTFCIDHCKYYYLCIVTVRIEKKKVLFIFHAT